jgi:plastocyanin
MKRLSSIIIGTLAVIAVGLVIYFQAPVAQGHAHRAEAGQQNGGSVLNNATVSFGGWMTDPPLDRFPNISPIEPNHHRLTPQIAKIKAGGTVNFIIGGFHLVAIYDNGTRPQDIDTTITVPPTNGGPPLIADPENRIYRGLDPSLQPQDRVEVVHFDQPGRYLVICGVSPHFAEGMYGYVHVIGHNTDVAEAGE